MFLPSYFLNLVESVKRISEDASIYVLMSHVQMDSLKTSVLFLIGDRLRTSGFEIYQNESF